MGPAPAQDTRIVIVDDTPDMRLLMRVLLDRYAGYTIVGEAENGLEAIELAQLHQPDVVLLDLAMPEMDGLEALPQIKRAASGAKVIVLSTFDADQMAAAAVGAGASTYVRKGASPEELVHTIAATLGQPVPELKTRPERPGAHRPIDQLPTEQPDNDPTRIIARTAHELRNPAIILTMLAEQLLRSRETMDPATVDTLLLAIVRQAAALDQLTDDLLTSTRAKRGALSVRPQPLDLGEVLEEALAAHDGADVKLECAESIGVMADRLRLQQMIGNLISNARKYGAAPIEVMCAPLGREVEIRVIDRGPGVPRHFQAEMFREYTRAEPGAGSGTGLGLFIVDSLARAHGGSIRYEPDAPATTFCLTLPRAVLPEPSGPEPSGPERSG